MDNKDLLQLCTFNLLNGLDATTTLLGLSREVNPLLNSLFNVDIGATIVIKLFMGFFASILLFHLAKWKLPGKVLNVFLVLIVVSNTISILIN